MFEFQIGISYHPSGISVLNILIAAALLTLQADKLMCWPAINYIVSTQISHHREVHRYIKI